MAKPKNVIEETNVVEETVIQETPARQKRVRKEIDRNQLVEVISNVTGGFFYSNRSGTVQFELADYGDSTDLTFSELQELKTSQNTILKDGWLLIEDDEIVELFGLSKMYENVVRPYELDDFFKESEGTIKEKIKNMPKGCRQSIAAKALEKYRAGDLDSTRIQRAIEEALGYDLFRRN